MQPNYDVIIIGAGIHGAGVAQAAAARGYTVLVLEQHGVASGTSSRSSKLIHGGLRYLEQHHFSLVRECLRERDLLLRLAPDLVQLKPFFIPVYQQTSRRPGLIRLGLSVYSLLDGLRRNSRFRTLDRAEWNGLDGLETRGLQQVFCYQDAQTDDAALTRAVLHSACSLGAELAFPATLTQVQRHAQGCEVEFTYQGKSSSCQARVLVNAAGPWINEVMQKISPAVRPLPMELVQGTHLVIDASVKHGLYYLEAPQDRRAVFVMPWQGRMLLGTTETPYQGDPASVTPLPQECDYLLEVLQHYFPRFTQQSVTVLNAFAGLRVLPHASQASFHRPRETLLWCDDEQRPSVVGIYGGKLTAYRATAEKILQRLRNVLPRRKTCADTRRIALQPVSVTQADVAEHERN
jgi:glycerol-3-phosphate dehydrogenase